jgi:hypothetical protein
MLRRSWETKRRLILESNKRILREGRDEFVKKKKKDFEIAVKFCSEVEKWWDGSSNLFFDPVDSDGNKTEYAQFFCPYQGTIFQMDNDAAASRAYKTKVMYDLNQKLDKKNFTFQNEADITLTFEEEGLTKYFKVDPEIDVSRCKESDK